MRVVACRSRGCGRAGIVRTVHDTAVAPGIVTRPPLFCVECGSEMTNAETAVAVPPETATKRPPRNATRQPPETR